jgi:hypothetical protein
VTAEWRVGRLRYAAHWLAATGSRAEIAAIGGPWVLSRKSC